MANPFSGIITSAMKTLFNNAINAMLASDACGRTCRIYYGITKYETCSDCSGNPIGKKNSNAYIAGGYAPVGSTNQCPTCHGEGKRPVESTEDVVLCTIFDYKKFAPMGTTFSIAEGSFAQTLCHISLLPKLKNANYILLNNTISPYSEHKFQRFGEPEPCGLGSDDYILTLWKRM